MYVLRRIRLGSRNGQHVRPSTDQEGRRATLRGPDKRLADALQQLSSGVPLNWGQIEDDPELATLSLLDEAARECRRGVAGRIPPEVRSGIMEKLEKRLPEPKPEQAKAAPKSMAGFSENVPVLTQVEEDVPSLISNAPQWVAATLLAGLVVTAALWVIGTLFFPVYVPKYDWIEVLQAGKPVTVQQQVKGKTLPSCSDFSLIDPAAKRKFIRLPDDRQQLLSVASFPVQFLPRSITATINIAPTTLITTTIKPGTLEPGVTPSIAPTGGGTTVLTYTLVLNDILVAPCLGGTPDPGDPAPAVRLNYQLLSSIQGQRRVVSTAPLVVFQVKEQPVFLDATNGSWKEVKAEGWHGVYWRGAPYRDIEGKDWIGDVSVLIIERDGVVTTFVGDANGRVTEEVLTRLAETLQSGSR